MSKKTKAFLTADELNSLTEEEFTAWANTLTERIQQQEEKEQKNKPKENTLRREKPPGTGYWIGNQWQSTGKQQTHYGYTPRCKKFHVKQVAYTLPIGDISIEIQGHSGGQTVPAVDTTDKTLFVSCKSSSVEPPAPPPPPPEPKPLVKLASSLEDKLTKKLLSQFKKSALPAPKPAPQQAQVHVSIDWPDMRAPKVHKDFWSTLLDTAIALGYTKICFFCVGGHGRTGTALAAILISYCGWDAEKAINYVREKYCDEAVETKSQENYLEQLDKKLNKPK